MEGLDISPAIRQEVSERWARRQCEDRLQEPTEDNKMETLGDVLYVQRDNKHSHRFILDSVTDRQVQQQQLPLSRCRHNDMHLFFRLFNYPPWD